MGLGCLCLKTNVLQADFRSSLHCLSYCSLRMEWNLPTSFLFYNQLLATSSQHATISMQSSISLECHFYTSGQYAKRIYSYHHFFLRLTHSKPIISQQTFAVTHSWLLHSSLQSRAKVINLANDPLKLIITSWQLEAQPRKHPDGPSTGIALAIWAAIGGLYSNPERMTLKTR